LKNLLKRSLGWTESLCPKCLRVIPAEIYTDAERVFMQKKCPDHGLFRTLVWSDYLLYKRFLHFARAGTAPNHFATSTWRGCPYDCGLCPEHKQRTCLAILEITSGCNLNCPVCLASSKAEMDHEISRIEYVLKKFLIYEGKPRALQISGGEPTVRKDLVEVVQVARELGFKSIEVDTNGIELGRNPKLAKELADAGLRGVYLQLDSLGSMENTCLRGAYPDLLPLKEVAIERAKKAGLETVIAATIVKGVNDNQLWDIIKHGIRKDARGVNFQTFTASGRYPRRLFDPMKRVTIPDILRGIHEQSGGRLKTWDFMPISCQDNRCATLTYAIVKNGKITPISRMVDAERLLTYYSRVADFDEILSAVNEMLFIRGNNNAACCGPLLDMLKGQYFSIACHSLQDAWNFDLERVKKCCVHTLLTDGKLVPFCLHHITNLDGISFPSV